MYFFLNNSKIKDKDAHRHLNTNRIRGLFKCETFLYCNFLNETYYLLSSYILPDFNHLFSHVGTEGKSGKPTSYLCWELPGCGLQGTTVFCFTWGPLPFGSASLLITVGLTPAWKQVIRFTNCYSWDLLAYLHHQEGKKHMKILRQNVRTPPNLVLILTKWVVESYISFRIIDKVTFLSWKKFWITHKWSKKTEGCSAMNQCKFF